jgi:hypothetical protein
MVTNKQAQTRPVGRRPGGAVVQRFETIQFDALKDNVTASTDETKGAAVWSPDQGHEPKIAQPNRKMPPSGLLTNGTNRRPQTLFFRPG